MGAGAKSEAIRLVESANQVLGATSVRDLDAEPSVHRTRMEHAFDHGLTRRVDQRVRQTKIEAPHWFALTAEGAEAAIDADRSLVVVLGSHPDGHVRAAATRAGADRLANPHPDETRKPSAGVTGMLAHRAIDPVPAVRELAIEAVSTLFAGELHPDFKGRMPTGVERAAREMVAQAKALSLCPGLVGQALDLFDCRVGRYSNDGVRDHHRHSLKEVDRRGQLLDELQRLVPTLDDPGAVEVGARLVDFYQRSMRPVRAGDPGAVLDTAHRQS